MPREYLIVIPARYQSLRFPGKPLADIKGKSMLQRVWGKCLLSTNAEQIIVATDDVRIEKHCMSNSMNVIRTPVACLTGTDRVAEVAKKISASFYINVQGDEPLIDPADIDKVIAAYRQEANISYCAMTKIDKKEDYYNRNTIKVVFGKNDRLIYMSRAGIPANKEGSSIPTMKQVCIYAFSKKHLMEFGLGKNKTKNEEIEDIEILRLLELGYKVSMVEVNSSSVAVDTPDDLKKVISRIDD